MEQGAEAQSLTTPKPTSATGAVEDPTPLSARPSPAAHDVAPDQAQIGLLMPDQETTTKEDHGPSAPTGAQTHGKLEIDFNGTPWEEDIWADKEDLVAAKNSIITVSKSLHVSDTLAVHPTYPYQLA